jgi:hypothetical protein
LPSGILVPVESMISHAISMIAFLSFEKPVVSRSNTIYIHLSRSISGIGRDAVGVLAGVGAALVSVPFAPVTLTCLVMVLASLIMAPVCNILLLPFPYTLELRSQACKATSKCKRCFM